jgi:hypothetical protein
MSALSIQPTFPIFTDIDGQPLEAGYVWIGTANLDPQTNPINVYWDAALTIAAPQPIRTLAGYPSRSGTPARLYVNSDYSIRVMNKNGSTVYSAPVATERYSDVVLEPFIGFKDQVGTVQDLADNDGSDWIGFVQSGSGVVARSAQDKMREFWDVEDFAGATDQIKVQAAFDSGKPIRFSKSYSVDSVTISSIGQTIDFNGYSIIGTRSLSTTKAQFVLGITGRQLTLYNIDVNANFKNYVAAIRWHSVSNAAPAQFNNVYGMNVAYCEIGLLFGQEIGTPSVDAAQSENSIYGFKCRGAQQTFVGNQSNGWVTFISPQMDCNPYEWLLQPGFNVTTWQTAARVMINLVGHVVVLGGEALKTSTQLGYGIEGRLIYLIGTTIEIACANFLVRGKLTLKDNSNFYMASDSANLFTIASDAGDSGDAMVTLDNCEPYRGDNVWSYSGSSMIQGNSTTPVIFNFVNCAISNWIQYRIASDDPAVGAGQTSNAILRFVNTKLVNRNLSGAIVLNITLQNTSSATTTAIASASTIDIVNAGQIFHVSGAAAINTIAIPYTSFRGSVTIIPDGAFTLTTAGNIGKASTAVVSQAMTLHYDGVRWFPSY